MGMLLSGAGGLRAGSIIGYGMSGRIGGGYPDLGLGVPNFSERTKRPSIAGRLRGSSAATAATAERGQRAAAAATAERGQRAAAALAGRGATIRGARRAASVYGCG